MSHFKLKLPSIVTGHVIPPTIERKNAEKTAKQKQQKFQNITTIISLSLSATSIIISVAALIISIVN
jgi:hypothetical protein